MFEQLDNYDWENNDFNIPNSIFSNESEKGKRDADGILDIFDRYNFTMNEDEPLECEVAIDPEMLGKVFENLLDVKDRKSKGAFYTPREIVHYMCQETLISYLTQKSQLPEEDIRDFILYGDLMKDEDTTKEAREGNKDLLISEKIYSLKSGVNRINELDDLLANVKVADLAVGSGAFPLGMLNEIVRARETLTAYMAIGRNAFDKKALYSERKTYYLKVNTIKNCIFACDIEPSAVDISKLRLWLSIVIDDELVEKVTNGGMFDEHTKPRQLPNLDCNIICGNSLIDEFNGIKLIDESDLLNNVSQNKQMSLFQSGVDTLLSRLIELQDKLFFIKEHNEKEEVKAQIQAIYDQIILEQGIKENPELREEYIVGTELSSKPFVLWQLFFPRVFRDNGGFDIVIGNPPYVNVEKMPNREAIFRIFDTCAGRTDLYVAFIEKGSQLLCKNGSLSFIIPFAYTNQNYGQLSRKMLLDKFFIDEIVDTSNYMVFDTAMVKNIILRFSKRQNQGTTRIRVVNSADEFNARNFNDCIINQALYENVPMNSFKTNGFQDTLALREKIDAISVRLDDICLVAYGVRVNSKTDKEKPKSYYIKEEYSEGYKPFIEGRNIQRYQHEQAGWLNYCPDEHYNPMFPELFENEKIIFIRVVSENLRFSYDNKGLYNSHTVINCVRLDKLRKSNHGTAKKACKGCKDFAFVEKYEMKFILGILNSKLINWYFSTFISDGINFYPENAKQLPIINIVGRENIQNRVIELVDDIIDAKNINGSTDRLEVELDKLVYELYGLSEDEIATIEGCI